MDDLDAVKNSVFRHVSAVLQRDAMLASSNPTLQVGRLADCVVRSGNVCIPLLGAQQVSTRYLQAMFQQDYPRVDCDMLASGDETVAKGIYIVVPIADEERRTTVSAWTVQAALNVLARVLVFVLLLGLIDLLLVSHGRYFFALMKAVGVVALCESVLDQAARAKVAVLLWLLGDARR